MLINIQDDIIRLHAAGLLTRLLADKTTGRNIMWATDAYAEHGTKYERNEQIMPELITGSNTGIIKTRARKAFEQQTERTRRRAEVFTPLWICKKMTEHFYTECASGQDTDKLINSRQLEITCGEAPFLVSRYDTTTGEPIPISERIGLLDRKLQLVGKITENEDDWLKLAKRAYESTYGYEFQGDNLLIARVNLIETFAEYMSDRWQREPTAAEMRLIINIITWNVWQMDGLSGKIPYKTADEDNVQLSFFEEEIKAEQPLCRIFDWRARRPLEYNTMGKGNKIMKFDFIIGNPPFNEEAPGTSTSDKPIYNYFMSASYELSDKVMLITPARFLFNAGGTPSEWNKKMLNDSHLSVLFYEEDSQAVFAGKQLPGGIAITYRDKDKDFGAIKLFIKFKELYEIDRKVKTKGERTIDSIIYGQNKFDLVQLYKDYPDMKNKIGSEGKDKRFRQIVMERFDYLFLKEPDKEPCLRTLGLIERKREYRYIKRKYVEQEDWIDKYKVFVPFSNGASGTLGEQSARLISKPVLGLPGDGITQTFIGFGAYDSEQEATNLLSYIKTKFARVLLGILKVTQGNKSDTWVHVPLQDFSKNSDIDWSKSIPEIDKQLYAKYGLTDDEITFIETHVKEMT